MTVLNGLVIMGQRSSIDWLCVGRWCKEVEGSTFHWSNFAPPQKKKTKTDVSWAAADLAVTLLSTGVRQRTVTSLVWSCLIRVYMPNLVCPSVRPVWSNQSLACHRSPLASSAAGGILGAQTLVMSVPRVVVVLFFFMCACVRARVCVCFFSRQGFLQGCSERANFFLVICVSAPAGEGRRDGSVTKSSWMCHAPLVASCPL